MFDHMVDMTEPICQKLDPHLAAMTIFDTSGIEALLPVLVDFFQKHPLIALRLFLVMLLLTRLKSANLFSVKLDLKKHLFLSA